MTEPIQLPEATIRWSSASWRSLSRSFWHVLTEYDFHIMNFENVPEPAAVLVSFIQHIPSNFLFILPSALKNLIGYGFATVFGILIGLLMGRSKLAEDFFVSYIKYFALFRCWIPLAILMWPTEESLSSSSLLGALPNRPQYGLGAEQTPAVLVRAAQSLGASRFKFSGIVIPSAVSLLVWRSAWASHGFLATASDILPGTLIR